MKRSTATGIGFVAVLLWALLALFTAASGQVPPFQLAAMAFAVGGEIAFRIEYAFGYGMALVCALTWSSYSVLSRRFSGVPTDVVTGFCLATAVLAALCHVLLEQTVWPANAGQWLAVLGLGLGPVGLAFYVWDYGVKHGDMAPRRVVLCRAVAVDAGPDCHRFCRTHLDRRGRMSADHRWSRPRIGRIKAIFREVDLY